MTFTHCQAMDLLAGLIPFEEHDSGSPLLSAQSLERLFVFALMWSVGALLELEDRAKMELFLTEKVSVAIEYIQVLVCEY